MTKATIKLLDYLKSGGCVRMDFTGNPVIYNNTLDFIQQTQRPFIERLIKDGAIVNKGRQFFHYITNKGLNQLEQEKCKQ